MMNVILLAEVPDRKIGYLSLVDVKRIPGQTNAKAVILTHFRMRMLQAKPWKLAERRAAETGIKVIAARDGMTLDIQELWG